MPCSICLSLSDLFHAAQYSVGPSTFLQMSKVLPFYGWIIFHSGCVYIRLVCTWWALGLLSCLGYCKWCKPESFLSLEQLSSARGRRSCWIISVPNILHMCVSCCNWIILHKLLIFSNDFTLSHCQNLYMPMFSFWKFWKDLFCEFSTVCMNIQNQCHFVWDFCSICGRGEWRVQTYSYQHVKSIPTCLLLLLFSYLLGYFLLRSCS